jgi:methyl-accepting chemotaxis protein
MQRATMRIVTRLTLIFSLFAASLVTAGAYGLWQLGQSQSRFENFYTNILPAIEDLDAATANMTDIRIFLYRHAMTSDPSGKTDIEAVVTERKKSLEDLIEKYSKNDVSDETDRKLTADDKENLAAYESATSKFMETSRSGDMEVTRTVLFGGGPLDTTSKKLRAGLAAHVDYNVKLASDLRDSNESAYRSSILAFVIGILSILVAAGLTALRALGHIRRSLRDIQTVLQDTSDSLNLTQRAPVNCMDELGQTATAFNALMARVSEVLGSVRVSTESVTVASREIASGNTDLSARTEEQAASLEETAASMTQLTETVKQNADNARQANALATNATDMADAGNDAVQSMVGTIGKISASSSKISEITGVIEGIAFQTNILALNAAVEAARAGEQGRGFAVVASEVRSLAQRSSAAAKEIKELIESSVATVKDGAKQAMAVGDTMGDVKQAMKRVSDLIGEIAAASEEQSRGIEQVNQAVGQMDEVTQQNAALVEQAAAAAQSLEEQATKLKDEVSVFKVADAGSPTQGLSIAKSPSRVLPPVTKTVKTAPVKSKTIVSAQSVISAATEAADADWQNF